MVSKQIHHNRRQQHDSLVRRIYGDTYLVLPHDFPICKSMEMGLYLHGALVVTPDLFIVTHRGSYFVEVKLHPNQKSRQKAYRQLETASRWAQYHEIAHPNYLYVTPRYHYRSVAQMAHNLTVENVPIGAEWSPN